MHKLITGVVFLLACLSTNATDIDRQKMRFTEREEAIYAHMKRYGINRSDVIAIKDLYESTPPYSYPHVGIATANLIKPGEHYRIEMDDYILTMKAPVSEPYSRNTIWPYISTRQPEPAMKKLLTNEHGFLATAKLSWYVCNGLLSSRLLGGCESMGISMYYRVINAEERDNYTPPANLRATVEEFQRSRVPTKEEIERAHREKAIDYRMGNRIVLTAEPVVINGRIWIRSTMSSGSKPTYKYFTYLHPDRVLMVNASPPNYEYAANPNLSSYPEWIQQSFAQLEEMINSVRITKMSDDGYLDPFVLERVEPASQPIREALPK